MNIKNSTYNRLSNRSYDKLRKINITRNFINNADGSVLIEMGRTKVLCNAKILDGTPKFITDKGWITAEYSMLPCATKERNVREAIVGYQSGRTKEIQRIIGRSLRTAFNLENIKGKTINVDCDVLEADGGTRCASINGGFIAVFEAIKTLYPHYIDNIIKEKIAAVSIGKIDRHLVLDMDYSEDYICDIDCNVIMNEKGHIIELQSSSEKNTFNRHELNDMLDLAYLGIKNIIKQYEFLLDETL